MSNMFTHSCQNYKFSRIFLLNIFMLKEIARLRPYLVLKSERIEVYQIFVYHRRRYLFNI